MAQREVLALTEVSAGQGQIEAPQTGDTYLMPSDAQVDADLDVTGTITVDDIVESTASHGVEIEQVLIQDGNIQSYRDNGTDTKYTISGGLLKLGVTDTVNQYRVTNGRDDSHIGFCGGTSLEDGAAVIIYGKDHSAYPGDFLVTVGDGTSYYTAMEFDESAGSWTISSGTGSKTEALTIDSSQQVGVGTTSPDNLFHVSGVSTSATTDSGNTVRIEDTSPELALVGNAYNEANINFGDDASADSGGIRYYHGSDQLRLRSAGASQVTVDGSGNLGVGTTSPGTHIHVAGATTAAAVNSSATMILEDSSPVLNLSGGVNNEGQVRFGDNANSGAGGFKYQNINDQFRMWTNVTFAYCVDSSQNMGIGTTSPDTKLHVTGAITQEPLSSDPANPDAGNSVMWVSDGTGSGDAGDVMMKINVGGTTKTITLVDYSAA